MEGDAPLLGLPCACSCVFFLYLNHVCLCMRIREGGQHVWLFRPWGGRGTRYCRYRGVLGPSPRGRLFVCTLLGNVFIACCAQVVGNPETGGIVGPLPERPNSRRPRSADHRLRQNAIPRNHKQLTNHLGAGKPGNWGHRRTIAMVPEPSTTTR